MTHCPDCPMRADEDCLGHADPTVCGFAREGHGAVVRMANETVGSTPLESSDVPESEARTAPDLIADRLARVVACPERGSTLPHTLQPDCGCAELTECRAERGAVPGRVTLRDCLACPVATGGPPRPILNPKT